MTAADEVAEEDLPGGLAYFEWCAEADDDPHDVAALARANPALGTRLGLGFINGVEREELTAEEFIVERLGVWDEDPDVVARVISETAWAAARKPKSQPTGTLALALDVSPDGRSAAIAVSDGSHVEVAAYKPGTAWVIKRLPKMIAKHEPIGVAIDPRGPAGSLLEDLTAAGVVLTEVTAQQYAQACGSLLIACDEHRPTLRHRGQPVLDAAVGGATRRPLVDAWAWSRKSSAVDICPLVAVTLARWAAGAIEAPPRPAVVGDVDEDAYARALAQIEEDEARAYEALRHDP